MSPILLASRGHQPVRPPASRRDELAGELRLTLVIAHLGIGGAQKVLVSLANSWAARGWTVTLIAVGDRGPSYFPLHPKVRERSLDLQAPSGNLVRALRNNWLRLLQLRAPELEADGEMHADAALSKRILDQVMPDSRLTAEANLLLMPNIDAANITFNALKIVAGQGVTVGPILLGAARPVHILTPTSTVRRLVNMTALTAVDAATLR